MTRDHAGHVARRPHHLPAGEAAVVPRRVRPDPECAVRRREHVLHRKVPRVQRGHELDGGGEAVGGRDSFLNYASWQVSSEILYQMDVPILPSFAISFESRPKSCTSRPGTTYPAPAVKCGCAGGSRTAVASMFTGRNPPWDKFVTLFADDSTWTWLNIKLLFRSLVVQYHLTSDHLAVFNAPDDVFLAEVGAVQERNVDEDVVVRLHDVLGLRAEDGAPLEAHDGLESEVAVGILEWKGQACSSSAPANAFPIDASNPVSPTLKSSCTMSLCSRLSSMTAA